MADKFAIFFLFILQFLLICGDKSALNDNLNRELTCEEQCTKSFSPHTYPNGSENSACSRGCRLYIITKFLTSDEPQQVFNDDDQAPALILCHHSCVEAYNETSSATVACKVGCKSQDDLSIKEEKQQQIGPDVNFLRPLMEIREVTSKVAGMLRIIQSSLTTYFMRDDNSVVAVRGPVEIRVELNSQPVVNNLIEEQEPEPHHDSVIKEKIKGTISDVESSWDCFSKRIGIPPYILLVSFISFAIFFVYIFLVFCPSRGKKEKNNLPKSTSIPTHALPVQLVRPEDLTKLSLMDEEEGLAPSVHTTKFKLPDNTII